MSLKEQHLYIVCIFLLVVCASLLVAIVLTNRGYDTLPEKKSPVMMTSLAYTTENDNSNIKLLDKQEELIDTDAPVGPPYSVDIVDGEITRESLYSICTFVGAKYSIQPELLYSMCEIESSRNVLAKNGSCKGLMQISSIWHLDRVIKLGITNIYDPYSNILLAADYINELRSQNSDMSYVLMRYNMDTVTANRLFAKGQITSYALNIMANAESFPHDLIKSV